MCTVLLPPVATQLQLTNISYQQHFPYNVIFFYVLFILYFTLFVTELHMRPRLPRFYHNNTLLSLLSHRACCYIYFIQTNSCILFKTLYYITQGSQPNIPQISTSGTHTHGQHTATYQINNLTMQTSREVVTALSTKDDPLKLVKQL